MSNRAVSSAFRQLKAFVLRQTAAVPAPTLWMLEVTSRCNLSCVMCPRDSVEFPVHDMALEFVQQLIEANPKLAELWPYGYGEPLMHPRISEIIRYAKQKGIVVSLSTNGTFLSAEMGRKLIESDLDYLILAFDGATAETYERYRRGASFQRVQANIESFLAMKVRYQSSMHVTVQMIRMEGNAAQVGLFESIWNREGVDRVRIREDLSRESVASCRPSGTAAGRPCFFLWRGPAFIQASGTLLPCPYYHGEDPFGDLNVESLQDAWNSRKMIRLREAHLSGDLSAFPICASCPRYQPHPVVAAASFFATTRSIRRLMPLAEDLQRHFKWKVFE